MTIREEIAATREQILEIATRYGACNDRTFGSVAHGDAVPDRDFDFLVNLEPGQRLIDHLALQQDLENLLRRKVDVASQQGLHAYIRAQVMGGSVPL